MFLLKFLVLSFVMLSSCAFRLGGMRAVSRSLLNSNALTVRGGATKRISDNLSMAIQRRRLSTKAKAPLVTPITVLSGFLGAGKTTFLHHLLNNQQGLKIGLVVNDMASVNIDAKQVKSQTLQTMDGIDTMELQNGCVCCSLAEDMIASVARLIDMADANKSNYHHIVVECSGIAEPRRIRDFFQEAESIDIDFVKRVKLDTLITLVDASAFFQLFGSDTEIAEHRELAFRQDTFGGENVQEQDSNAQRKITELLLEQVECADIVLINKIDLLSSEAEIELVKKVIMKMNPTAKVMTCTRGEVSDPLSLVASAKGLGAAKVGIVDELKTLVQTVDAENHLNTCQDPVHCSDPSHHHHDNNHHDDHDHGHEHGHDHACTASSSGTCTDPSHNHDHGHDHDHHAATTACASTTCTDPTHHHDHTHTHSHDHNHNHEMTTAEERFGITSFVYRRRRPFHPERFSSFLRTMGKLSINKMDALLPSSSSSSASNDEVIKGVNQDFHIARNAILRSKGFVWMGVSKSAGFFLSHAGQYLEIGTIGRWWADIAPEDWPAGVDVKADFEGIHGDRRQEIVFIGQFGKSHSEAQKLFENVLDTCLLNDEEMAQYEQVAKTQGDAALRALYYPDLPPLPEDDDDQEEEDRKL